ncbi:hypothetical protein NP233_g6460 [Leucocoprinus birnbaumii]|uniref:F-box domain-containing protein n=1 Tax=Leucocoprinus birnbaumii TaxID=56174 RepID=A0AAD5YPZ9_9AGAR|nr:hypothetical protein NP233_g6460 [Leucocoprinus birnbaumii]
MKLISPPSKALLRTGYLFPDEEPPKAIGTTVVRGSCRLRAVEDEIHRLRKLTTKLLLKKQAISTFVDTHRELLAPFNRLPSDVLEEIFHHTLPTAHNAVMDTDEPPLLLSRVCTRWRRVAYATPRLWASIHITAIVPPSFKHRRRDGRKLEAIANWLSRSGALPLSITLSYKSPHAPPPLPFVPQSADPEDCPPEMEIIALHIRRWKSVHLDLRRSSWLPAFLSRFSPHDVPLLQSLCIIGNLNESTGFLIWDEEEDPAFSLRDSLLNAPQLRSLALMRSVAPDLEIYSPNLTALEITYGVRSLPLDWGSEFQMLYRLLMHCSNLESLSLRYLIPLHRGVPSTALSWSRMSLPHLRSLRLIMRNVAVELGCRLLEALSAPALKHLTYHYRPKYSTRRPRVPLKPSDEAQRRLVQCLDSFFGSQVNALEELDLSLGSFDQSFISEILCLSPGLKRLSLGGLHVSPFNHSFLEGLDEASRRSLNSLDDSFLRYLTSLKGGELEGDCALEPESLNKDEESRDIIPNVELIRFWHVEFSPQATIDFLRSRSFTCLQKISITSFVPLSGDISQTDIAALVERIERETGLQIYLQYIQAGASTFLDDFHHSHDPYAGIIPTSNMNSFFFSAW